MAALRVGSVSVTVTSCGSCNSIMMMAESLKPTPNSLQPFPSHSMVLLTRILDIQRGKPCPLPKHLAGLKD